MILLDTNVILEYKKLKLFFRKRELATTKACLEEVKKLAKKDKILLSLVEGIKIIETSSKKADDSLVEAAKKYGFKVATFDRVLVERLKEEGLEVLCSDKEILGELS